MPAIPHDSRVDSTWALLSDPYHFISKQCRQHAADLFETRLLLQRTICMTGREAAELFYNPEFFQRHGAPPGIVQKTLFGRGGVQELDGAAHRHRKQMLLSLMAPERIGDLGRRNLDEWHAAVPKWSTRPRVELYDATREMLTRTVCAWAGVPLDVAEVGRRKDELSALFRYAGNAGPTNWWARISRQRANHWIKALIEKIRAGRFNPPEESAAYVIAWHRDLNAQLLPLPVAAVELLNVLRPTVAVSVYLTFIAHALHEHPECRQMVQSNRGGYVDAFVNEVRRFYPFFPAVVARVRRNFKWNGYRFAEGTRVLLDLYGINHDPRLWDAPDEFRPERFFQYVQNPYDFVPQGGGDHSTNHRCPGEWITIELMKIAANFLAGQIRYTVPDQNLVVNDSQLPAMVESGFLISDVAAAD